MNDVRQRHVFISIDGQPFATLAYGDSVTRDVRAGRHSLRAHNTLVWKNLEAELEPGDNAQFQVINRPGFGTYAMLSLLGTGPIYLTFERMP